MNAARSQRMRSSAFVRSDIWQSRFHGHIIRNEADYQRICQYIDKNPAKWQEDRYDYILIRLLKFA
jgi:hypothetical protein